MAVDDSKRENDFGCRAAGRVSVSVDGTWRARFSWFGRRSHMTAFAISMAFEYFFILIFVPVLFLHSRFIGEKTGIDLDKTRHGIQ